ncbi:MAG TPA: condensation domain-containing protein, partial [Thermoanaerobaculia bacterium]|nr:condensation domain-containing protein [Thermoanaerobaculia bacterium]
AEEGEEPVQRIHPPRPADLRVADLAGIPAAERDALAIELARAGLRQPFELDRGPLLRALLLRLGEQDHVLLFSIHHIVSDGWSMGVLVREVGALYRAAVLEQPASLPDLPIQYADYAVWQRNWLRGETLAEHVAYWRGRLAGAPALLGLPTDRPRPAVQRFQGERADVRLPSEPSAELRALAQRRGATPFMALLAVFAALLRRHSGEDDIVIGTPVANRDRAELEGLIGLFVNSLPLRVEMAGAPSFEDLLGRVRATAVGAYAHQGLPFEKVVVELQPQRDLSSSPVFQVMLTLQNVPAQALDLPGLELRPFAAEIGAAKLDLTLDLFETPAGFAGSLEYNTDLFDRSTIDRLKGHFRNLVAAAAAAPGTSISDLSLLSPAERHQLAVEWSDTAAEYPAAGGLHELIARQAARTPEAVAVTFEDEVLTYGELEARAGRLARFLAGNGVRRESLVGLCMERSLALPAVLLGILAAGAAYVPMDPDYPEERLGYMLEDAGLSLLLVGPGAPEGLCRRAAGRLSVIRYDEIGPEAERGLGGPLAPPTPPAPIAPVDPGALAYVLYTSGSTGRPKGVEIPHGALVNFLASMSEQPGLGQHDVLLAVTSLSFDIAGLELYLPLLAGARVDLASREVAADGGALLARVWDSGATVLQATPATWRMLIDAGWEGEPEVRALCGGE